VRRVLRFLVFLGAMAVVVAAVAIVFHFTDATEKSSGRLSGDLIDMLSTGDFLVGGYLEAHAEELSLPAGPGGTPITFVVKPGETAAEIAQHLESAGLVSDAQLFRRYVQFHDLDAGIEAAEYTLSESMTIPEIAEALQTGRRPERVVTIPEGLRLEQVAREVAAQASVQEDAFLSLATVGWREVGFPFGFLSDVPDGNSLEGFLFPDTYRLPEQPTAHDVLDRMLSTFDERVTPEVRSAAAAHGLTLYDAVTLASIIEREAALETERALIGGVYYNRLRGGWFLGACPTVQYALGVEGNWWPEFTLAATEAESPFNTYRNLGLPPTPICSPGLAAIDAAASPADTDYYFFLADCEKGDGSHLFAATQEEHNANYVRCGGVVP
jgi:UPF0755 protein